MEQEVRYLDDHEKIRSRNLWEEAFPEDSQSFDDYYFTEKVKDNRILVLENNGQIDSMLHLNPYLLQVKDFRWRIDYIVGVATRADCRHRGYMRRLLGRMMADLRVENMPFCFLMPADEAIYRPFGFTYIYRKPQWKWKKTPERRSIKGNRACLEELADWMNRWLAGRYQAYALRDTDYLVRMMKEIASENGTLDVCYDGGSMIGMESRWGWDKKEERLLYAEEPYICESAEAKPAVMARIISAEAFVGAACLAASVKSEKMMLKLRLTDPLIAENDGVWNWHLTHETSWLERVEQTEEAQISLTVTELTEWLFGYGIPEKAEPYRDMIQALDGVFLDEIV